MIKCITTFVLFFITSTVTAQIDIRKAIPTTGKTYRDFIPVGYDTLDWGESVVNGDLNKDGLEDVVIVLYNIELEKQGVDADRPLLILLKDGDKYYLNTIATSAVMCRDCGGMMGDPFVGVFIKNNVLTVSHAGGSAWRWSADMKFRLQNGDFYLIGKTTNSFWVNAECDLIGEGAKNYEDVNYITGDRVRKKTSERCKVLLDKKDRIEIKPLEKMVNIKVTDN